MRGKDYIIEQAYLSIKLQVWPRFAILLLESYHSEASRVLGADGIVSLVLKI